MRFARRSLPAGRQESLDLVLDLRDEVRHTGQVGDRCELLVDPVVGTDGRQLPQILEVIRVAAVAVRGAQLSFTFFRSVGRG